jgi:hypothetical protein
MAYHPANTRSHSARRPKFGGFALLKQFLRLTFFSGPKELLTSRISLKCAILMVLMCVPALLFCAMLTIPEWVFQSPEQQVYYYFSKMLNQDPTRWFVLALVGACAFVSLAVPGALRETNPPLPN